MLAYNRITGHIAWNIQESFKDITTYLDIDPKAFSIITESPPNMIIVFATLISYEEVILLYLIQKMKKELNLLPVLLSLNMHLHVSIVSSMPFRIL